MKIILALLKSIINAKIKTKPRHVLYHTGAYYMLFYVNQPSAPNAISYFPHFFLSGIKSMKPHRRMLIMEMISSHRWLERLATLAAPETLLLPE